jgi:arsenate reductase
MEDAMIFLCYPKCSTCQKAKAWLDANQIPYTLRDITTANPSYEELFTWQERSQLPLRKLFNTSGLLYRSQGLKDKLESMTKEEQLSLLATDGMLVKRPLLVDDDKILVGFQEAKWAEALLNDK